MKIYKKVFETNDNTAEERDAERFASGALLPPKNEEERKKASFAGLQSELVTEIRAIWDSKGLGDFVNQSEGANWEVSQYFGNTLRATAMALEGMNPREIFSIYTIHKRGNSKVDEDHELLGFSREGDPENPIYHKVIAASQARNEMRLRQADGLKTAEMETKIADLKSFGQEGDLFFAQVSSQNRLIANIKKHKDNLIGKEFVLLDGPPIESTKANNFLDTFSQFKVEKIMKFNEIETRQGKGGTSGGTFLSFTVLKDYTTIPTKREKIPDIREKVSPGNVERALDTKEASLILRSMTKFANSKNYSSLSVEEQTDIKREIEQKILSSFEQLQSGLDNRSDFGLKIYTLPFSMLTNPRERSQFAKRIATKVSTSILGKRRPETGLEVATSTVENKYIVTKTFYDFMTNMRVLPSRRDDYFYSYDESADVGIDWRLVKEAIKESFDDLSDRILELKNLIESPDLDNIVVSNDNLLEVASRVSDMSATKAIFYLTSHFSNEELINAEGRVVSQNEKGFSRGNEATPLAILMLKMLARHKKGSIQGESNPLTFALEIYNSALNAGYEKEEAGLFLTSFVSELSDEGEILVSPKDEMMIKFVRDNPDILLYPMIDYKLEKIEKIDGLDFTSRDLFELFTRILERAKSISSERLVGSRYKEILNNLYKVVTEQATQIGFNMSVLNAAGEM